MRPSAASSRPLLRNVESIGRCAATLLLVVAASVLTLAGPRAQAVSFSAPAVFDNNGLIIVASPGLHVMDENGNSFRTVSAGDDPAWSPDGQHVVFQDGEGELVVSELDGGNAQVLTDTSTSEWKPAWSPDGSRIAFMRDSAIWVMNADGSNQQQVTSVCCNSAPSWSPDGTKLVFDSDRVAGRWQIFMVDLTVGEPAVQLTDSAGHNRWPDWSPDGSQVVFVTTRTGPANANLWLMDPDGGNESALTVDVSFNERDPQWSPDGQRIVFSHGGKVSFIDPDGTNFKKLAEAGYVPDWQPLPACTMTGTNGPDELQGTSGPDVLCGGDGDDTLAGGGGDDILLGQEGTDTLSFEPTGSGVDVNLLTGAVTGQGNDFTLLNEDATGTQSDDTFLGNEDGNRFDGGEGDDSIAPAAGADQVLGGPGVDTVVGAHHSGMDLDLAAGTLQEHFTIDSVSGVENARGRPNSNDTLRGDDGPNILDGGGGNYDQFLQGRGGDDVLIGSGRAIYWDAPGPVTVDLAAGTAEGDGNDTLIGITNVEGSDYADNLSGVLTPHGSTIVGRAGNDTITSGPDHGWLFGGIGNDTVRFTGATSGVTLDLATGTQFYLGTSEPPVVEFENVTGTPYADSLSGTSEANIMVGGGGVDQISAGSGDDEILGGSGNDVLTPGLGDDQVNGGTGTDRVSYAHAIHGMTIDLVLLSATGLGVDSLLAIENVTGSAYADTIRGSAVANVLYGGSRADTLYGRGGGDSILGGPGRDLMYGGSGRDVLRAKDSEIDQVNGGTQRDVCYIERIDRVTSCP